jgi:hypothetical protein
MFYVYYKATLRCRRTRSFKDRFPTPDRGVLHCAYIALLHPGCCCTCTNLLDLVLDLAIYCVLDGAWLALSDLVHILECKDIADTRGTRLEEHRCWAFKAEEQLGTVSTMNLQSMTKTYPIAPDGPPRPSLDGVPCG